MTLLSRLDALVARTRTWWLWLGQLALLALGVHLAADHLDDAIAAGLRALPLPWPDPETPTALGTWGALCMELIGVLWSAWALARAHEAPVATIRDWGRRASIHAVSAPLAWLPLALAGAWSIGMATEDTVASWLPTMKDDGFTVAQGAGWMAAALVVWRIAWPGLVDLVRCTPTPKHRREGLLWLPVLVVLSGFAWRYGVPVWGLLGVAP
jgi:hypothetical protein